MPVAAHFVADFPDNAEKSLNLLNYINCNNKFTKFLLLLYFFIK